MIKKLTREFYTQDVLTVAPELLGKILVCRVGEEFLRYRITETEAYRGAEDFACHACKGRTLRTEAMFHIGGVIYVYLIYGMYHCFNVVVNDINIPQCVLIRAVEPAEGIGLMQKRRWRFPYIGGQGAFPSHGGVPEGRGGSPEEQRNLCNGPGKLSIAFGINMKHYGIDLNGNILYIEDTYKNNFGVESSKRIGMGEVGEARDYLYRFTMNKRNGGA